MNPIIVAPLCTVCAPADAATEPWKYAVAASPADYICCQYTAEEEEEAKKVAFAANRAAHYNMAAALRGHVSLDSDDSV